MVVAQSSQMLKNCEPLQTAKQFLRRWCQKGVPPSQSAARLMEDAGFGPEAQEQHAAARPAPFASRSVRRALLMPQANPGSLFRCGKRT